MKLCGAAREVNLSMTHCDKNESPGVVRQFCHAQFRDDMKETLRERAENDFTSCKEHYQMAFEVGANLTCEIVFAWPEIR